MASNVTKKSWKYLYFTHASIEIAPNNKKMRILWRMMISILRQTWEIRVNPAIPRPRISSAFYYLIMSFSLIELSWSSWFLIEHYPEVFRRLDDPEVFRRMDDRILYDIDIDLFTCWYVFEKLTFVVSILYNSLTLQRCKLLRFILQNDNTGLNITHCPMAQGK